MGCGARFRSYKTPLYSKGKNTPSAEMSIKNQPKGFSNVDCGNCPIGSTLGVAEPQAKRLDRSSTT